MDVKDNRKKHRILFLTYHLPMPDEPGAFRPWMEARILARAGYDVTVVTSGVQYMTGKDIRQNGGWCTEEVQEGIRILRTWAPADHRSSVLKRIINYCSYTVLAGISSIVKVKGVDLIFAGTDPIFMMPMVFLISKLKHGSMVIDERDLFPETAIALGVLKEGLVSRILFKMQQFFRRRARSIIAATPGIRKQLIAYGHSCEKIHLLYNADAFLKEDGRGETLCRSLRAETGRCFLIGYAGGLGAANDIHTLLRSARFLEDIQELGIVIIGSGEKALEYIDYCNRYSLRNVTFIGAVPRRDARQLLEQVDICVHMYPANELFLGALASKTFDYLGMGKPMIFCGRGDTEELLRKSGAGICVEPEDDRALAEAIRKLFQDDAVRGEMGAAAIRWFEGHINPASASVVLQKALDMRD